MQFILNGVSGGKRAWWRNQMETISALLALCAGKPPVTPHNGQWCGALVFSLICTWTNDWANNRDASDLRRHRVHYDVTRMETATIALTLHDRRGVSNRRQLNCLSNSLFKLASKERPKHHITGPFVRRIHQSPVDSPNKLALNVQSVFMIACNGAKKTIALCNAMVSPLLTIVFHEAIEIVFVIQWLRF